MFRLWIDDLRIPPDETWRWGKNVHEAKIHFIQLGGFDGKPGIVSLDHDAGSYGPPDYIKFLEWLEWKANGEGFDFSNITFQLHTMNTVGYLRMKTIIEHNGWKME